MPVDLMREWWVEVDGDSPVQQSAITAEDAAKLATQADIECHGATAWDGEEHDVMVWSATTENADKQRFMVTVHVAWSFSAYEWDDEDDQEVSDA